MRRRNWLGCWFWYLHFIICSVGVLTHRFKTFSENLVPRSGPIEENVLLLVISAQMTGWMRVFVFDHHWGE